MPLINVPNLLLTEDRLTKEFNCDYEEQLAQAWYEPFMLRLPSSGRKEVRKWLLSTAQIYALDGEGEMRFDDLQTQDQEIENKEHGVGLKIQANQYKDDEFEFAADWAGQIGIASALYPQRLLLQLLGVGESKLAYDGVPFFSASHPNNPAASGGAVYSNVIAANPLNSTNLNLAVARVQGFQLPSGESRALQPARLLVGPNLRKAATELLNATFIAATDNVYKDYNLQPVIAPQIQGDDWYLAAASTKRQAPAIYQEREPFVMTSYDNATSRELSIAKELQWHLRGRVVAEFGHPYMMIKSKAV